MKEIKDKKRGKRADRSVPGIIRKVCSCAFMLIYMVFFLGSMEIILLTPYIQELRGSDVPLYRVLYTGIKFIYDNSWGFLHGTTYEDFALNRWTEGWATFHILIYLVFGGIITCRILGNLGAFRPDDQ
ncbi:MAG: hypothetical protein M1510_13125 [Nitrospirae bacterium]|nr:hypothetical protein [Nitrospirota bacterium]